MTVPVALGVGMGSLSILLSLHSPFTILFTPHPAQSNPAPSAPQSQGGPPQPQLPPQHHGGCLTPAFFFFFFMEGKRSAFGAPPHPHLVPRFLSAKEGTPPPAPNMPHWVSVEVYWQNLGAIQSCPHEGKASLQDAWLRWRWGMPSPGTL